MAQIAAEHIYEQLIRAGYVIKKKVPRQDQADLDPQNSLTE